MAAYATVRALERAGTWWLVLAMAAVGTGFITKMLQAFLVVPAIAVVYLIAAPTPLRRRVAAARRRSAVALVVSSGWWVAAVQLTPAADRPYIGGSQDNSLLNLIFGYNGLGRISGNESGSVGGAGAAGSRWGPTGLLRFFGTEFGTQISWLIPAARHPGRGVAVAVAATAPHRPRPAAAMVLWGGWLIVTVLVISLAKGIIHPYYSVAAAPAIGAMVGIGSFGPVGAAIPPRGPHRAAPAALGGHRGVVRTVLLDRAPQWMPWLRTAVLVVGLGGRRGPRARAPAARQGGPGPGRRSGSARRWPAPPPTPSTRSPPHTPGRSPRRDRPRPPGRVALRARRVASAVPRAAASAAGSAHGRRPARGPGGPGAAVGGFGVRRRGRRRGPSPGGVRTLGDAGASAGLREHSPEQERRPGGSAPAGGFPGGSGRAGSCPSARRAASW